MKNRNENRVGYKMTPAGWLPDEWQCLPAGHLLDIQLGKMLSKDARRGENPLPYLANYNVRWGDFELSELQQMDFYEKEMHKYRLRYGDLLVCEGGEVGRCAIWKDQVKPCYFQKALHRARPANGMADIYFVMYFLQHVASSPQMVFFVGRSSISHFTLERFKRFPIAVPPLPEQHKISKVLSAWDAAIAQTRNLIAARKMRKTALMRQLLMGKVRLPGFAGRKGRRSYPFFDLPTDWGYPKIGEIARERSERNKGGKNTIVLSCSKHQGFVASAQYFGKQVFSEDTSNYKVIRRGWFGYPSNHIEEGSIGLLSDHETGAVSPIYTVFECAGKVLPEYLYALFKTETYRHIFSVMTNASVDRRGSLRWKQFASIRVPLPQKSEQKAISSVLSTADLEIETLEKKLKAMEKQKRGLMKKLLTGEVRVQV
jgi:type I restriction enzyme, S subunit